jgi:hypothetical protein
VTTARRIEGRTIAEWARELGVSDSALRRRLQCGLDTETALTPGPLPRYVPELVEFDNPDLLDDVLAGESCARVLAERHGISERTVVRVRGRLRAQGRRVRVPEGA